MSRLKLILLPALCLLLLTPLAVACGPSAGADSSAEDILAQARDAMAELESFRYAANATLSDNPDEPARNLILEGEWGAPDRHAMTMVISLPANDGAEPPESPRTEWLASDGMVVLRDITHDDDATWREHFAGPVDTPPWAMSPELPEGLEDIQRQEDTTVEGTDAYHIIAVEQLDVADDVATTSHSLYVAQDTHRLLRWSMTMHRTTDGDPDAEPTEVMSANYRLFNFNEPVEIYLPDEWEPAHYVQPANSHESTGASP